MKRRKKIEYHDRDGKIASISIRKVPWLYNGSIVRINVESTIDTARYSYVYYNTLVPMPVELTDDNLQRRSDEVDHLRDHLPNALGIVLEERIGFGGQHAARVLWTLATGHIKILWHSVKNLLCVLAR